MNHTTEVPKAIFPLSAVTRRLNELLVEVESRRFWVQAQFIPENKGQNQGGHCYCSLVENDEDGRTVARMRAVIWRSARGYSLTREASMLIKSMRATLNSAQAEIVEVLDELNTADENGR
jgi:hypothetical protein